ncbi:Occludin/ELL domain-containing protein 1 [Saguinus oedipus]|uniref:Occludin/ELL domain-containing protein 1 n=1 Tax=Saguinus oedipus TaxID=9490 RepID=A0ABQ9TS91_SAGOE|nr:Occludin/ELL domain-containing protein 1 [Saguinus oedipus]
MQSGAGSGSGYGPIACVYAKTIDGVRVGSSRTRLPTPRVSVRAARCVLSTCPPAGRPQTTPAARGPRRPPQDPPISPETTELRLPETDAHPGAPQDSRLSGAPAAEPPAWARAPGEPDQDGLQGLTPRGLKTSVPRPPCQPQPGPHKARPKTIVFEDELLSQALLGAKKPVGAIPKGHVPRPHPVPDYELKYRPVSSARERSRYVAVFQDQYGEYLELQREVGCAQAKLRQLEARLSSLPPPQSQKEAQVAARVWREFEKKQTDPGFLDKQARCHYLKGKLRHLKTQIQKFDDRGDSEGSVYF